MTPYEIYCCLHPNVTANIIARTFGKRLLQQLGQDDVSVEKSIMHWSNVLNKKAQELGMLNTHIMSPSGLDLLPEGSHAYSNAIDILKMFAAATQYPEIMQAWSQPQHILHIYRDQMLIKRKIETTVIPVLKNDAYVIGGKTGTLTRYGYSVGILLHLPNGKRVVAATMGAASDEDRTQDIRKLIKFILDSENI